MLDLQNILPSALQFGLGGIDGAKRFCAKPSERRPAAIANEFAQKNSAFFKKTPGNFKEWKESPVDAALEKAANKAASTIRDGLVTKDLKKVYQGLKRLHNAEQKFPKKGGEALTIVNKAVAAVPSGDLGSTLGFLNSDGLIKQYSDRKSLFHCVLKRLERIGLVTKNYMNERNKRINDLENNIKKCLDSIRTDYLVFNKFCPEQICDKNRISLFRDLKNSAPEGYKLNFLEKSLGQSDIFEIRDDQDKCIFRLEQHKVSLNDINSNKKEKELKIAIDKNENEDFKEASKQFHKDYERIKRHYKINGQPLEIEKQEDLKKFIQYEGIKVIHGIGVQTIFPILFEDICINLGEYSEIEFNFTVNENHKLEKIDYTYSADLATESVERQNTFKQMAKDTVRNSPDLPYSYAKSMKANIGLNVQYGDDGQSSVTFDKFDCSYTKLLDNG